MLAHTCTSAALYMLGHPMSKNGLAYFFLEKKKICRCSRTLQSMSPVGSCPGPHTDMETHATMGGNGSGTGSCSCISYCVLRTHHAERDGCSLQEGQHQPQQKAKWAKLRQATTGWEMLHQPCRAESGQLAVRPPWCGGRRAAGNTFNIFMD